MTDKRKKRSLCESDRIYVPTYRIEADGRGTKLCVAVIGVIGVREFSPSRINVVTKRESLLISGDDLKMSVFENKTVEICGEVSGITFSSRKRGGSRG